MIAKEASGFGRRRTLSWIFGGAVLAALVAVLAASPAFGFSFAIPVQATPTALLQATSSASSGLSVHSHAYAISTGPTTKTPKIDAPKGSDLFVFVGYVNSIIGGGVISAISDSSGDSFHLLTTTGYAVNHTEALYVAKDVAGSSHLTVKVSFSGGDTTQGGSVSVVDVVGAAASLGGHFKESRIGTTAFLGVTTSSSGVLFLLGTVGRGFAAPFTAAPHEKLLDTAGADAGPFADGVGFGTFASADRTGTFALYATLNQSSDWDAIAVAILPK